MGFLTHPTGRHFPWSLHLHRGVRRQAQLPELRVLHLGGCIGWTWQCAFSELRQDDQGTKNKLFWVVVTQIYCLFSPRKLGKIPILTHIFQMGYNHQVVFLTIGQWLNNFNFLGLHMFSRGNIKFKRLCQGPVAK